MKLFFTRLKIVAIAITAFLIFINADRSFAQDSVLSQNFLKGVNASSLTANTGYQSAALKWASVEFSDTNAKQAGYLVIYSTSAPSLLNSPNGKKPNNAILNGTVVPTIAVGLPNQPETSTNATGLTNGTTYNFMIVAYEWDGINTSSYVYSAAATICITIPPSSPDGLSVPVSGLSSNSISGLFDVPVSQPDGYVVSYSKNENAPALVNGIEYQAGQTFQGDTVLQVGSSSSFSTSSSLLPATTYYIHVFSYVLSGCTNKPVYSSAYLSDSATTLAEEKKDTVSNPEGLVEVIDVEPNPAVSNAWLKIVINNSDVAAISMFTIGGKYIASRTIQLQAGVNRFRLGTENFVTGMYILKVTLKSGKSKTLKFIKK